MKNILLISMLFAGVTAYPQTRIAVIGASITAGATLANPSNDSYPGQLQTLLGNSYIVNNFGVSSSTMLRNGNFSYWQTGAYKAALKSRPDVVFIDLGGNDAKAINRKYYDGLEKDACDMIESFKQLPSHPRVILLLPFVSFETDTMQIWDKIIVNDIIPRLQSAAYREDIEVLDIHPLLIDKPEWFADKIHPSKEGHAIIAKRLFEQITQQFDTSFDILKNLRPPFTLTAFKGYACAEFKLDGRDCKIVQPKKAAQGRPWIWRARFWAHEPQTDIALLERGFHVVYCDASELLGNDTAINIWNRFYAGLHNAGLSQKAVLEGMSRGGVYVFNWAAANPSKVACVYVDNPLLNIKAWAQATMQTDSTNDMLKAFKASYHITGNAQLDTFSNSPVDKVPQIVQGNYPILIVCADADEAVSPADNTLLFEQKIKALKGNITVIHKPGFKHHPHSLPNPTPIVDFILEATINKH